MDCYSLGAGAIIIITGRVEGDLSVWGRAGGGPGDRELTGMKSLSEGVSFCS